MHSEALTSMHSRCMVAILGCVLAFIVIARLLTLGAYPILDPTEGRYAQVGKVMLETGNWITPQLDIHVPLLAKPPLSIWAIAVSYATFGINAFAARFPSFLAWLLTVGLVFSVASAEGKPRDRITALLATCVFASSMLRKSRSGGRFMTIPSQKS